MDPSEHQGLDPFRWKFRLRNNSASSSIAPGGPETPTLSFMSSGIPTSVALPQQPRGAAKRKLGSSANLPTSSSLSSSSSSLGAAACLSAKSMTASAESVAAACKNQAARSVAANAVAAAAAAAAAATTSPNTTVAVTSQPSNESELQLYRVLQRANLLSYYDIFIAQGGDDVHQLIEAGEEEFLEIMALVGMASKPLHVRRLQKALHEWAQNPVPLSNFTAPSAAAAVIRGASTVTAAATATSAPSVTTPISALPSSPTPNSPPTNRNTPPGAMALNQQSSIRQSPSPLAGVTKDNYPPTSGGSSTGGVSPTYSQSGSDYPLSSSPSLQLTPVLVELQIQKISETAANLVKALPPSVDPKPPNNKKKISKELETVFAMEDSDPRKMEEIRRFSAIYGRFDCKRKPEKPLTLHEVSVNEAAAQLCMLLPGLLTRRDELFPLARQVVRDSGYQYSKGHSRSQFISGFPSKLLGGQTTPSPNANGGSGGGEGDSNSRDSLPSSKRSRLSFENSDLKKDRISEISVQLRQLEDRMAELKKALSHARDTSDIQALHTLTQQFEIMTTEHNRLVNEQQQDHTRYLEMRFGNSRMSASSDQPDEHTDEDSGTGNGGQMISYSNTNSPSQTPSSVGGFVLSESGGQIIAVQNPALSQSSLTSSRRATPPSSYALLNLSKNSNPEGNTDSSSLTRTYRKRNRSTKDNDSCANNELQDTFKQEPESPPPKRLTISPSPTRISKN